jgi:hypothetical protein
VQVPGIEEEVVTDANEVVMPEYEKPDYNEPEQEPIESVIGDVSTDKDKVLVSKTEILQEIPQQEVSDIMPEREMPVESEILPKHELQSEQDSELSNRENLLSDRYDYSVESGNQDRAYFPEDFEEYHPLPIESRLELQGIHADVNADDIFRIVKENFDKAGYAAEFDELYEETAAIQKYLKAQQYSGSVDGIVQKFQKYGSYDSIPLGVKADVFAFGFTNASENLDIYMKVLKQLGVKMEQSEMFEDYQAIYEETVKRQEKEGDKRWNRDKIR